MHYVMFDLQLTHIVRGCLFAGVLAAATLSGRLAVAAEPSAQEVLAAADKVRNPTASFKFVNDLVEYRNGVEDDRLALQVYSKLDPGTEQYRNLARYTRPARDAGKVFLMNRNIMWFYDPAASARIRISPQQRLIGQASNGDVLSINLEKDYTAQLIGAEQINDADRKPRQTWHLNLTAATGAAVYARVEYWVEKDTNYPVKAVYYSDSGRKLKLAYYCGFKTEMGGVRPTQVIILDEVDASVVTRMTLSGYEKAEVPENWFDYEFLARLP
jgi:outer membrane lipoprotein-sorting protein